MERFYRCSPYGRLVKGVKSFTVLKGVYEKYFCAHLASQNFKLLSNTSLTRSPICPGHGHVDGQPQKIDLHHNHYIDDNWMIAKYWLLKEQKTWKNICNKLAYILEEFKLDTGQFAFATDRGFNMACRRKNGPRLDCKPCIRNAVVSTSLARTVRILFSMWKTQLTKTL